MGERVEGGMGEGGFWGTNVSGTYPHDLYSITCIYALVMHFHAISRSSVEIFCDAMQVKMCTLVRTISSNAVF
jgi:hypothetical protein